MGLEEYGDGQYWMGRYYADYIHKPTEYVSFMYRREGDINVSYRHILPRLITEGADCVIWTKSKLNWKNNGVVEIDDELFSIKDIRLDTSAVNNNTFFKLQYNPAMAYYLTLEKRVGG